MPGRNWNAKLFPSLSSDFIENSGETEREKEAERQCDETDMPVYISARCQQRLQRYSHTVDKTHAVDNLCKHTLQDKHKVCVHKLQIAR